eukprot:SAG31_NODE_2117_length_6412_cov_7.762712_6_plen_175_part_00
MVVGAVYCTFANDGETGRASRWKWNNATQQLTSGDGMCVTASASAPSCNRTPQPCREHGHTYCPSDPTPGQCNDPPKKTCPPCKTGPTANEATIILGRKLLMRRPGEAKPRASVGVVNSSDAGQATQSFALLFLNNKPNATTITCDAACVKELGIPNGRYDSLFGLACRGGRKE